MRAMTKRIRLDTSMHESKLAESSFQTNFMIHIYPGQRKSGCARNVCFVLELRYLPFTRSTNAPTYISSNALLTA